MSLSTSMLFDVLPMKIEMHSDFYRQLFTTTLRVAVSYLSPLRESNMLGMLHSVVRILTSKFANSMSL